MEKMNGMSMDLTRENIEKVKELFPHATTEGKIDFDKLRLILGENVASVREKYQFIWNGKSESLKLSQQQSSATLRTCMKKSKNWDTTKNLFIEGDNLEVLKLLQKTYFNRIKMIYIDPPYNTGGDFVYKDNYKNPFEAYLEQTGQDASSNPETSGRYHTDWLNMMYSRLLLARNLLQDTGVMFMSIDDHEVDNLIKISDEVFGETNRIAILVWKKKYTGGKGTSTFVDYHEYILAYAKHKEMLGDISMPRPESEKNKFTEEDEYVETRGKFYTRPLKSNLDPRPTLVYPIELPDGGVVTTQWICAKDTYEKLLKEGRIEFKDSKKSKYPVYKKFYEKDDGGNVKIPSFIEISNNNEAKEELKELFGIVQTRDLPFQTPKPTKLLKFLIDNFTDKDDIILDFFAGSASTAHAVMQSSIESGKQRKYIMVQLPEKCPEESSAYKLGFKTIADIGESRIDKAGELIIANMKNKALSKGDANPDIGYKVFRLDSSNINPWDNTRELDEQTLFDAVSVFKQDRSNDDIAYEILLKYGIFDQPVRKETINNKGIFRVGNRYMIICLENDITLEDVNEISNLKPKVVVFKEEGFKDDNEKMNAVYNLQKCGVEEVKTI